MKTFEEINNILREHKKYLTEKYKIKEIGIFGSYVKGEVNPESDIDVLVEFEETPSLWKFIGIENHLEDLLEIKVDLVLKDSLKSEIREDILKEVVYL